MDGQGTTWRRNIAENFNRLSRAHQRYRRQTDDRRQTDGPSMTYSERELEFTFAKNYCQYLKLLSYFNLPYNDSVLCFVLGQVKIATKMKCCI